MRVFMLGVMFAIAAIMPTSVNADDQQIADFIKARLMQEKQQGNLYGFNVDMRVDRGTVWFKGFVSTRAQELMILRTAQLAGHLGVVQVVDDIDINGGNTVVQNQPMQNQPMQNQSMQNQPMQMQPKQGMPMQPQMQPQQQVVQQMAPQRVAMRPETYRPPMVQQQPINMSRRNAPVPNMGLPQPQNRPMAPGVRPGVMPMQNNQMQPAGVPLSVAPKSDENTKRVAYQEPIAAPFPSTGINGAISQPQASPSFQQSLLNPVQGQTISTPISQPTTSVPPNPTAIAGPPLPFARAAAPQGCDSGCGGCESGACGGGGGYYDGGAGGISSDTANLPGYAWPAYASHPNYGAVSYPKQYSASAWPYIGPFYPYPQVPLGWRKVSLEWDDGWWFLDFDDK